LDSKVDGQLKLKDKVAIVVGGGAGIGRASSKLFADEGAKVMVADIDIDSANKVAAEIKAAGHEVATFRIDFTKEKEAQAMVKATLDRFGKIDILANVAGGSVGKGIREKLGPFAQSTKEEWDRIFDINVNGPRNCTKAVLPHMMERRSGKIVCFASIAAVNGMANGTDYAAAKGAIIAFTRSLAIEMAPYGIFVNCVTPSGVVTERIRNFMASTVDRDGPDDKRAMSNLATPEELAAATLFMVSDDSNHVSGQNIIFGVPFSRPARWLRKTDGYFAGTGVSINECDKIHS
jgi:NAD(P)-dependent dehydrogenase (short-subunit alcohol dehydrogenase family)